jgi:hypothetical protein
LKKIIVAISPTGETTVKTTGYFGKTCKEASAWIKKALGTTTSEKDTPEGRSTGGQSERNTAGA